MMIILINGSYRRSGITAAALHMIEEGFNEKGIKTLFYDLGDISMSHCTGYSSCYKTGHCCINDDAERISERIAEPYYASSSISSKRNGHCAKHF